MNNITVKGNSILQWTTLTDLKNKVISRWNSGELLVEAIEPGSQFPLRLSIKAPSSNELSSCFSAVQDWVAQWVKATNNATLTLEWRDINHRQLGRNKLPAALILSTLDDTVRWLGKSRDFHDFIRMANHLLSEFPSLKSWILKNSHVVLREKENLVRLMSILRWVTSNPRPNIYLRQISLPGIDTKFIEQHKKLLAEWFDLELPSEAISKEFTGISRFEARYGFKEKPAQVRFRMLDKSLYINGCSDLMICVADFSRLSLAVKTVFITENDINGLIFPDYPQAIVLFGRGYGFDFLQEAYWLKDKTVFYWGDIDTHGFAILNQCRHHIPHLQSMLMNKDILLSHQSHWSKELKPSQAELAHLTAEEMELYVALRNNHHGEQVRLEQEFVSYDALLKFLIMS